MGCAKDEGSALKEKVEKTQPVNERFKNFIGVLKAGKEAAKDGFFRTNEALSVDETLWGLELSLNVLYAKTDVRYEKSDARTTSFTIQLQNGAVPIATVFSAYESMWGEMMSHYNSLNWTNKEFVLADVKLVSNENNAVNLDLTTVVVDVLATPDDVIDCDVFSPDDNWKVGGYYNKGKCDGTHLESAADIEIEKKVNELYLSDHPLISNPMEPFHIGFMNLDNISGYASDHVNYNQDPNNPDPLRTFLLWYAEAPDGTLPGNGVCIEEDNMEWYYCNMVQIIEDKTPSGESFVNLDFYHDNAFPNGTTIGLHRYTITYGTPIFVSDMWPVRTGEHAELDPDLEYFIMP